LRYPVFSSLLRFISIFYVFAFASASASASAFAFAFAFASITIPLSVAESYQAGSPGAISAPKG